MEEKTTSSVQHAAPDAKGAASATGKSNPFRPTLGIFDMIVYGLISMVPIAPMAIYGEVFQASNGMPTLAYLIGFLAVLFSVWSFGIMIERFPSSGSIFTYASHIMGPMMGFLTGWLMLLQYLVSPTLVYIIAGTALHGLIPEIPIWVWCVVFLALVAFISLRGMKATVKVNRAALVGELVVLFLFILFSVIYIATHDASQADLGKALVNPEEFKFSDMMSSVSLAVLSYVGFGAIATLTQEAKHPRTGPARAMMIMSIILLVLFTVQCYLATCVDPTGSSFKDNPDNGFYIVAQIAGGKWLSVACAVAVALAQGLFTALVSQTSVSLIMFSMARGGSLPRKLGTLKKGTNLPLAATISVIVLSAVLIPIMLPLGVGTVAKVSNFGALATYGILNVCVITFCWFQQKSRSNVFRHLIAPLLGAIICFGIMLSLNDIALRVGVIWIVIGLIYYCILKYGMHRDIKTL